MFLLFNQQSHLFSCPLVSVLKNGPWVTRWGNMNIPGSDLFQPSIRAFTQPDLVDKSKSLWHPHRSAFPPRSKIAWDKGESQGAHNSTKYQPYGSIRDEHAWHVLCDYEPPRKTTADDPYSTNEHNHHHNRHYQHHRKILRFRRCTPIGAVTAAGTHCFRFFHWIAKSYKTRLPTQAVFQHHGMVVLPLGRHSCGSTKASWCDIAPWVGSALSEESRANVVIGSKRWFVRDRSNCNEAPFRKPYWAFCDLKSMTAECSSSQRELSSVGVWPFTTWIGIFTVWPATPTVTRAKPSTREVSFFPKIKDRRCCLSMLISFSGSIPKVRYWSYSSCSVWAPMMDSLAPQSKMAFGLNLINVHCKCGFIHVDHLGAVVPSHRGSHPRH